MNYLRHAGRSKVTDVVSEILGVSEGQVVEHWDGRIDAKATPGVVAVPFDDIEEMTGLPPNDLRRLLYDWHRSRGATHDETLTTVFRDRKVVA